MGKSVASTLGYNSGKQSSSSSPDALTDEWRRKVYASGDAALQDPSKFAPGPGAQGALGFYQGAMGAGSRGAAALGGDASAMQGFMNPYEQEVINKMMGDYGLLADSTRTNINDNATRAGAFGGSRHGVAEGVALGDLGRAQGSQIAGLRHAGYQGAQQQAYAAANLGMGAAGAAPDLEKWMQMMQDPNMARALMQKMLMSGMPMGMNQKGKQSGWNTEVTGTTGG